MTDALKLTCSITNEERLKVPKQRVEILPVNNDGVVLCAIVN